MSDCPLRIFLRWLIQDQSSTRSQIITLRPFGASCLKISGFIQILPLTRAGKSRGPCDPKHQTFSRDLGSSWWRIHRRVVIPFAKPGITSGCTMVFMLSAGALAAPQILGGPSSLWFTQIIYQWFNTGSNWPRGSAYAIVLMLTCVLLVLILMKLFKVKIGEIGR